jgi:F-type H+-transporting ATPase subunit delta
MSETKVASRYAKSLLDLAKEQNKLEEVNNDITFFLNVCKQSPDLVKLFRNPVVKTDKKLNVVQKVFSPRVSQLTSLFLDIIVRKNREFYMVEIAREFRKQYNQLKGIVQAQVTTAVQIDDSLLSDIRGFISKQTGKQIELATKVNPDIIGGLVIQLEDKLYDASMASKLANIKKNLIKSHLTK